MPLVALVLALAFALPGPGAAQERGSDADGLTLEQALRATLEQHPLLQIQEKQVEVSRGLHRQAAGQFDLTLATFFTQSRTHVPLTLLQRQQAAQVGVDTVQLENQFTTFEAGPQKLFRNGLVLSSSVQVNRSADNLTNRTGLNQSRLSLQLDLPLLKNRGRGVVSAQETSAAREVEASTYDLNQAVADLAAGTAIAYWQNLAARQALDVAVGSEERGQTLVENVRTLVATDRVPRAELFTVAANLADRTASRLAAEQRVLESHQQLALAMGRRADEFALVGVPSEDFPDPSGPPPTVDAETVARFVGQALARRADVRAARKREEGARSLVVAARNQTRPQVDLSVATGWAGLVEGRKTGQFVDAPFTELQGPDVIAGLTFRFPPSNNLARGQVLQAESSLRQAELSTADLSRQIASSVVVALEAVRNAMLRVEKARESVQAFRSALEGERDKFRLGSGSLVSILTVEDRLTAALGGEVSARLAYAVALTQLRRATGTIVDPEGEVSRVEPSVFLSLPAGPGSSP